jgi:hypothetical protein
MSRKAPGMRKRRSCRQHKQAARADHRARTVSSRASSDMQTCRELFGMLNFRRKVISKVSMSVSFFAVPQRSPLHRDEHVR